MARYAASTSVTTGASIEEIRRTVERYGASAFGVLTEDGPEGGRAAITFVAQGRQLRMSLDLPSRSERRFTHTPSKGLVRTSEQARDAWEQACRQRWRALALLVKALLEAVESGIVAFSEAWLPYTVVPGTGMTVAESIGAQLEEAVEAGSPPRLMLPAPPA